MIFLENFSEGGVRIRVDVAQTGPGLAPLR